ncbi:acyl-CoA dehydrogenase, partial [Rhodococcus erythropolis]|nr:acyl-CoA dehydrogenase [Rhodococcus erythropolis]
PDCEAGSGVLLRRWEELVDEGDRLISGSDDAAQAASARYSDELARTVMATLLFDLADHGIRHGNGYRSLLVANSY